jgi:hypothetical protein
MVNELAFSRNQINSETVNLGTLYKALERCQQQVKPMEAFIDGLKSDFSNRRRRAAWKTAISKSRIAELQAQLEVAKTALITSIGITTLLSL